MFRRCLSFRGAKIQTFYDGNCPLCRKEISVLQWLNRHTQSIRFTNLHSDDFTTRSVLRESTKEDLLRRMHVVKLDESGEMGKEKGIVTGMDAMRLLYKHTNGVMSCLGSLLEVPGIKFLADSAYDRWAERRFKKLRYCNDASCKL